VRGERLLGGSEYLLFSAAVEGELVPLFAHEYCTPGAPVFFGSEKDHLLFALFAHKDDRLRRRKFHVNTSFALSGITVVVWRAVGLDPLGYAEGNFAHSRDGHKINDALLQSTYARRQVY
jgi:hypothetical protein